MIVVVSGNAGSRDLKKAFQTQPGGVGPAEDDPGLNPCLRRIRDDGMLHRFHESFDEEVVEIDAHLLILERKVPQPRKP